MVLDYGNPQYDDGGKPLTDSAQDAFAAYCNFVARSLSGKVWGYEVWNEWAGKTGRTQPGSSKTYTSLARKCSRKIKEADPSAKILVGTVTSPGLRNGWMESFLEAGGLQYGDGLSIHPYVHCQRNTSPEAWWKWLQDVMTRAKTANDNMDVSMYITEMGWPSNSGKCERDEYNAAEFILRTVLLSRTDKRIKGLWLYQLQNEGWDRSERKQEFRVT